ncbi:MAG TPA: hypothetical protein VEY69_16215 [Lautropia sp.]|nr:hypothetical protein [Lautropia sp.]
MTPSYRDAKARVDTLPPEQQEAYLRKLWAYKHELELAGLPWSGLTYLSYLLGAGLMLVSSKLPEQGGLVFAAGVAVVLSSFLLQRMATKKRLAYQLAHPFED